MNLRIDNEIDDDDVCEPRRNGYRFSVSAGKTKLKHFNLRSSTEFDLEELNESECLAEFRFRK